MSEEKPSDFINWNEFINHIYKAQEEKSWISLYDWFNEQINALCLSPLCPKCQEIDRFRNQILLDQEALMAAEKFALSVLPLIKAAQGKNP